MEIEKKKPKNLLSFSLLLSSSSSPCTTSSSLAIVLLLFTFLIHSPIPALSATSAGPFVPKDNYLIACGAKDTPTLPDGRIFKTDEQANALLDSQEEIKVSAQLLSNATSPIYSAARVFTQEATYAFHLAEPGWHWVRLHFFPIKNNDHDLTKAKFSVTTDKYVLLHTFNMENDTEVVVKEFILNTTDPKLSIKFSPIKDSSAFINAIEVVSAPDKLISDSGTLIAPASDMDGLSTRAFETVYRVNMGGPLITSQNDSLGRTWVPDKPYMKNENLGKTKSVQTSTIKYQEGEEQVGALIGPQSVYATAVQMADAEVGQPNFNVTWNFKAEPLYDYLVRFHFCDIVSKVLNVLYFNVYVNERAAITNLDLSHLLGGLGIAYYKDIVVNASMISDILNVQIGSAKKDSGDINAILNGIEIMKISNSVNSLDGEFGVDGKAESNSSNKGTVAAVGFGLMFGAFVGLGAMVYRWRKRPQDWQKSKSFSSWLLPVHASDTSFMNSKTSTGGHYSSSLGLGRLFTFAQLQEATKNFDSNAIIGVGGFGNVYIGEIDEGTKVAVKRGNPQSEQGITEFQTEIQMLSKLRHRHLVSLIGYCDENSEMILVYEFMSNGPFRDHLYGKDLAPLSWKQRLEICIGAARGLHYLHTGTAQGIIHRDVKTTNILLDNQFTAKVADFGLSKDAPMGQNHVSTAVKGSFGYLDPEYFRRQQLTDKSDVYSFGVVLLEALCARPAINPALPREQVNLADWAMQWKRKGLLDKIIDPLLVGTINLESMKKFAEAAEKCLADHGVDRPTMGDVLWNLEYALQLQESFSQEKAKEENKPSDPSSLVPVATAEVTPTGPLVLESRAVTPPLVEENRSGDGSNDIPSIDHSGTAMFAQFSNLNGR